MDTFNNSGLYQNATTIEMPTNEYHRLAMYAEELVANDKALMKASWIFLWTVVSLGFASNILLIFLFIRFRAAALKTSSNILIFSLACVDLCALSIVTLVESYLKFRLDQINVCVGISFSAGIFSAIFAAVVVSVIASQKFVAVFFPFKAKFWLKKRTAMKAVFVTLVVTALFTIPLWITSSEVIVLNENETRSVYHIIAITGRDYIDYAMTLESLAACVATTAIFITQPAIIYKLCNRKFSRNNKHYMDAIKLAVVMVIVFTFYLTLSLSKHIIWYILALEDVIVDRPVSSITQFMIKYWVFVSSPVSMLHIVVNPVLHALVTENFRKYYIPFACRKKHGSNKSAEAIS